MGTKHTAGGPDPLPEVSDPVHAGLDPRTRQQHFEHLARVGAIMSRHSNVDAVIAAVLDELLEIFGSDRAWFLYPCDPEAPAWQVPMEKTRPEFPGAFAEGQEVPMDAGVASQLREMLGAHGPRVYRYSDHAPYAIKSSPEGGKISLSFEAQRLPKAGGRDGGVPAVALKITDQGAGIQQAEPGSMLDGIGQASMSAPTAGATGLGLAISREIVAAHGGRIWARNRDHGDGSEYVVVVPAEPLTPQGKKGP
jgi:hypothetical protein